MKRDFTIIRGDDWNILFQRRNKNTQEIIKTVPEKMFFTVKRSCCEDEAVFQKTLGNGLDFDKEKGIYTLSISKGDTCSLMYFGYVYDIEIIENGKTHTILRGKINVDREVTHIGNEV